MGKPHRKKILIFANLADPHMIRFVKQLENQNPAGLTFYFFGGNYSSILDRNASQLYKNGYFIKRYFPNLLYSVPLLKSILSVIDLFISFIPLLKHRFDCINIHTFGVTSFILFPFIKLISRKILITPWGSDVYRISDKKKWLYKHTGYRFADYVATSGKFKEDIKSIFNVPENKFIELYFGSDLISVIESNRHISKQESKESLGFGDSYTIVCGYNSNPAQNHLKIVDSLISVKKDLPRNTCLVFPMTYGPDTPNYIKLIEEKLTAQNFKHVILTTYLSNENLFSYINAADMMIHMQESDAFSSAIKEYLLCDTKVINGSWLRYPNLEFAGIPYYLVEDFKNLSSTIIEAFNDKKTIVPSELRLYLTQFSWPNSIRKWITTFQDI